MRFTVPFLLAIAVYIATVLGANQTSFTPNEDMLYDVVSASDAIAFRLERALGMGEQLALMVGALLLTIPALLTFHLFRIGFGGSVQSLIQEDRLARELAKEREQIAAARYANAGAMPSSRAKDGEVLSRSRAGDGAKATNGGERRDGDDRRDGKERRRGLGSNIAAAFKGRSSSKGSDAAASETAATSSGTTSLSATEKPAKSPSSKSTGKESGRTALKDRWSGILETTPDLSRLKSGAKNLRQKITPRSGAGAATGAAASSATTKLSLDDIADESSDKSNGS